MNVRDVGERHPKLTMGVVSGGLFGLFVGLFLILTGGGRDVWLSVLLGVAGGVFFGVVFPWAVSLLSWRTGGPETARSISKAIRTRVLPDGVDSVWLDALAHRKNQAARYRWANPVLFVLLSGLGVGTVIGSFLPDWVGWVEIVGFLVLGMASVVQAHRELRAIDELERQLRSNQRA